MRGELRQRAKPLRLFFAPHRGLDALAILVPVAILGLSSIPAKAMPAHPGLWRWDKLFHAGEYALACALLLRVLLLRWRRPAGSVLVALVLTSALGALDESYQGLVPGRHSSVHDWMADSAGALFACVLLSVLYFRNERKDLHGNHTNI